MPLGIYDHPPAAGDEAISAMELPEAVPLLGLDSTRVLRQFAQLTRLRDAIQNVYDWFGE